MRTENAIIRVVLRLAEMLLRSGRPVTVQNPSRPGGDWEAMALASYAGYRVLVGDGAGARAA